MEPVYVAKSPHDKALQRALLQWKRPELRRLVVEALHRAGREDLIGYGKGCLVRPLAGRTEEKRPDSGHPRRGGKESGRHQGSSRGKERRDRPSGSGRRGRRSR